MNHCSESTVATIGIVAKWMCRCLMSIIVVLGACSQGPTLRNLHLLIALELGLDSPTRNRRAAYCVYTWGPALALFGYRLKQWFPVNRAGLIGLKVLSVGMVVTAQPGNSGGVVVSESGESGNEHSIHVATGFGRYVTKSPPALLSPQPCTLLQYRQSKTLIEL